MNVFYISIGVFLGALTVALIVNRKFVKKYIKGMPIFNYKAVFVVRYTLARPFILIANLLAGEVVITLNYKEMYKAMEKNKKR